MRILHISDTHGYHEQITIPENIDMIIHSGDESNYKSPMLNEFECLSFVEWFSALDIKYKIFIAGNHSTAIEKRLVNPSYLKSKGIIYLENSGTQIENINIWGSPITPSFCDWSFMKARDKMHKHWLNIPENTDILVVHGPPKTILDCTFNVDHELEYCGDESLRKRIIGLENLKLICFGHIHDCENITNNGVLYRDGKYYSNAAGVKDGRFEYGIIHQGHIFEIDENKKITIC